MKTLSRCSRVTHRRNDWATFQPYPPATTTARRKRMCRPSTVTRQTRASPPALSAGTICPCELMIAKNNNGGQRTGPCACARPDVRVRNITGRYRATISNDPFRRCPPATTGERIIRPAWWPIPVFEMDTPNETTNSSLADRPSDDRGAPNRNRKRPRTVRSEPGFLRKRSDATRIYRMLKRTSTITSISNPIFDTRSGLRGNVCVVHAFLRFKNTHFEHYLDNLKNTHLLYYLR